jgi:hypothetical protein
MSLPKEPTQLLPGSGSSPKVAALFECAQRIPLGNPCLVRLSQGGSHIRPEGGSRLKRRFSEAAKIE